ncbi:MAG: HAMP domain-containing histidine kinase [Caulobacteraceae bacterium]|nr:HAMP domain-containing histidine kinase [Caulobacteraceae bacterium]
MFRSTSTRLAALYTAGFALSVVVLGASILLSTGATLRRQFDTRLRAEAGALAEEFRTEGLSGVIQAVRERENTPGELDYGLQSPDGSPLAGRLSRTHAPEGWSRLSAPSGAQRTEVLRVLTTRLPQGYRLILGDSDEQNDALEDTLATSFEWAFVAVLVVGALGGYSLGRDVHRRLTAMTAAAEGIIDGDLVRRIPLGGSDDELDRLAATFNRMLDRIAALMESLRQVSNDVAHDLRTPLTRLRQRLEASRLAPAGEERTEAIAAAIDDVDAILETFAALLRIAQIEGGARRAGFKPVDLSEVARTVVDAFAPSAEDVGQCLTLQADTGVVIEGDAELLTQMTANLVENALRHAGDKTRVAVEVRRRRADAEIVVRDDGPGVPEAERERILDRFYRLERSRSTPGSGLGLALVSAVARLHGATLRLVDAAPGLKVSVSFSLTPEAGILGFSNTQDISRSPAQA